MWAIIGKKKTWTYDVGFMIPVKVGQIFYLNKLYTLRVIQN